MQLFHVPHYLVSKFNWYKHKKKRKCKIEVVCETNDIATKKALSHSGDNYYRCSESSINDSSDPTCIPGFIDTG